MDRALIARQMSTHLDPKGEIFTLVLQDGTVFVFNVTAMRAHVAEKKPGAEPGLIALDEDLRSHLAQAFLDTSRLARCSLDPIRDPAVGVLLDDGTTYVIDGHHRLARWFQVGMKDGVMALFEPSAWKPYVLDLPPELTAFLRDDTLSEPSRRL